MRSILFYAESHDLYSNLHNFQSLQTPKMANEIIPACPEQDSGLLPVLDAVRQNEGLPHVVEICPERLEAR